jgi:serine protease Do
MSTTRLAAMLIVSAISGCTRKPNSASAESTNWASRATPSTGAAALPALLGTDIIAEVASRASPAVVSVASTRVARVDAPEFPFFDDPFLRRFFGPQGPEGSPSPLPLPRGGDRVERGIGSGVIVGNDTIITNAHVVEGAKELEVTGQNKRVLKAKVVGTDSQSDLAVLRIEGEVAGLTALPFADSSQLRPGQVVLAIGNPFGVGQTVTMGIVSATSRADLGIEAYEDFIQTDAAINPGNSGGALVDLQGRLVGIPTAILSRTGGYMGVGFAIPSSMAQPITKSLLEHGRVDRGFLGVTIQNVDSDVAKALDLKTLDGVLISDVQPGGPAAKAGLRRGDVVLSIEGKAVQSTGQLRNVVAASPVGKAVRVEFMRGGERRTASVTLARVPDERGKEAASAAHPEESLGVAVAPVDGGTRQKLSAPATLNGLVVMGVVPGSPAERAGIEEGDVIVEADKKPVTKPEELAARFRESKGALALLVWRKQRTFYVVVKR